MAAGIKTGGRQKGSRNKPKAPPAPPAPAAAAAPPDPQPEPRAHAREKTAAGSGFPPYRLKRVDGLIPYERNARTHTPEQIDKLCRLIVANGWTNPILVAGQHILAGHARHAAALRLGLDRVPTIDLSHLTEDERRAVILSDNRSALDAGWDRELLAIELGELRDGGFDLALTGFDMPELGALFGGVGDGAGGGSGSLAAQFGVAPFSVLNAREGWWQDRKRAWLALGIQSEIGRGEGAATPPLPPTVTRNVDGTLNYGGTDGQAQRFDAQRQGRRPNAVPGTAPLDRARNAKANATPGGAMLPAADYSKRQRGDGRGRAAG